MRSKSKNGVRMSLEDYKERYEILKKISGLPQGTTRELIYIEIIINYIICVPY